MAPRRVHLRFPSWPGKSAKRVFALDVPAIHVFAIGPPAGGLPPALCGGADLKL
jgi:hypothetical protein